MRHVLVFTHKHCTKYCKVLCVICDIVQIRNRLVKGNLKNEKKPTNKLDLFAFNKNNKILKMGMGLLKL